MALHQSAVLQNRFAVRNELIECRQKSGLDVLLVQMRRPAFMVALELLVALPDNAAVFAVGMPYFGSVKTTAIAADDPRGKDAVSAVAVV